MKGIEGAIRRTPGLSWRVVLPFLTALLLAGYGLFSLFSPAGAVHVDPVFVAGNPSCSLLGYDNEFKVEPVSSGNHSDTASDLTVNLNVYNTDNGQEFDWNSGSFQIDGVIVKGGPGANHYIYNPAETSDDGLHAPLAPSGDWHGLSHISFCWDDPEPGTIIVEKDTADHPQHNGEFDFSIEGPSVDKTFELSTRSSSTKSETFNDLNPGVYTVDETDMPNVFEFLSLVCEVTDDFDGDADSTFTYDGTKVDVNLAEGETVHCTYTNQKVRGSITVVKETLPDGSDQKFDFEIENANGDDYFHDFPLMDGESESTVGTLMDEEYGDGIFYAALRPYQSYDVTEIVPDNWNLDGIVCTSEGSLDGQGSQTNITDGKRLEVKPGEDWTCTFTNEQDKGTIIVKKQTEPASSGVEFEFDPSWDASSFTLEHDEDKSFDLYPGEYTVNEIAAATGWAFDSVECTVDGDNNSDWDTNDSDGVDIDLESNDTVTCTFTNVETLGSISGSKDDGQGGEGWTILLFDDQGTQIDSTTTDGDGNYTFSNLEPGDYVVCEVLQENWTQTAPVSGAECDNGTVGHNVSLAAGEEETGYDFTNEPEIDPLSISKTVDASRVTTYSWELSKTVDPAVWHLFDGDQGVSTYTVDADRTVESDVYSVSGTITIVNGNAFDVEITGVTDVIDGSLSADSITCDVGGDEVTSFPYTLAAGATMECEYSFDSNDLNGDEENNVASVTTSDGEGDASSDPVAIDYDANHTEIDPTLTVNDSRDVIGEPWTFDGTDDPVTYQWTFDCSTAEYGQDGTWSDTFSNTASATLEDESTLTSTADVDVNCYQLQVSKDADTSWERTYTWDIDKSADPTTHNLLVGESATSTYEVEVTQTITDGNYQAFGTITIVNPNTERAAEITNVVDELSNGLNATVDCGGATSVPAGGSLDCSWSVDLDDDTSLTNSATVTMQNYTFVVDGDPAPNGTTDYTSEAVDVIFDAKPTNVNGFETVNITDTYEGATGAPWTTSTSQTFFYDREFVCTQETLGGESSVTFDVDNTATIVETGQSNDATVTVNCSTQPALEVSKTVELEFDRTWEWDITKSANPTLVELTPGETGDVVYTILVTKSGPIDSNWTATGAITVVNPADIAATVTGISDVISQSGLDDTAATITSCELNGVSVDVPSAGSPLTMQPGDELVCEYSADLPNGNDGNNNVVVSTTGNVPGAGASADVDFDTATISETLAEVEVTDNNDGAPDPWTFDSTGSVNYTLTYTCEDSGLEGAGSSSADFVNVATITETGASDDATVTVTCTDEPSSIEVVKTADPTEIGVFSGEPVVYTFTITNTSPDLDVTLTDWDDSLFGDLTNPTAPQGTDWEILDNTCVLPSDPLAPGESYTCELTVGIVGEDVGTEIVNVITVNGEDELGRDLTDSDDAVVTIVGEPPVVIPEAPLAILFPIIMLALGGGAYFIYRRREATGQIG